MSLIKPNQLIFDNYSKDYLFPHAHINPAKSQTPMHKHYVVSVLNLTTLVTFYRVYINGKFNNDHQKRGAQRRLNIKGGGEFTMIISEIDVG